MVKIAILLVGRLDRSLVPDSKHNLFYDSNLCLAVHGVDETLLVALFNKDTVALLAQVTVAGTLAGGGVVFSTRVV